MLVDTHSHIVPGLDDGAAHMEEAVQMARLSLEQGIRAIVATPHHANGSHDNPTDKVERAVLELNRELRGRHIDLEVMVGQEVRLHKRLLEELSAGTVLTLNRSRYLLLELPFDEVPEYAYEMIYELRLAGITPIIAHPERNARCLKQPELVADLIRQGALCQVTSHSISGLFGKKIQRFAKHLCKERLAHLIASDAHNCRRRSCMLAEAYSQVDSWLAKSDAEALRLNAEHVIRNEDIHVPDTQSLVKRKWFQFRGFTSIGG